MSDHDVIVENNRTTKFVVQNISQQFKTVNLFGYPVIYGQKRDLMAIPYISEADIRWSLIKGELLIKILAKEILISETNIDLLQFDNTHKSFLKSAGISIGTEIDETQLTVNLKNKINSSTGAPVNFFENQPLIGAKNDVNRIFMTTQTFLNGDYLGSSYFIRIRHNGRGLDPNTDYVVSESGGAGAGFDTITFVSFTPSSFSSLLADFESPT